MKRLSSTGVSPPVICGRPRVVAAVGLALGAMASTRIDSGCPATVLATTRTFAAAIPRSTI
jgi:hypothetical protein